MEEPLPHAEAVRDTQRILLVWVALMGLLAATMGIALRDLGWLNVVANLAIATAKTLLILWVYMHLREMSSLLRVIAVAVVLWLGFLFVLGLGDWMTRGPGAGG